MGSKVLLKWSKKINTSLVEQLIRAEKNLQKAIAIFDSATAEYTNGFRHDNRTFALMISRLVSANEFIQAEELLKRMKKECCCINEDIFLSIYRGYNRVHKPLEAVRIFESTKKEFQCEPTEKSYITIFSILVDENQIKMALRFYCYMRKIGIHTTVVSLNILIKALCKNSESLNVAVKIFHEMPNHECLPDSYTYGTLITGFCKFGRTDEANEIFKEMEANGCLPTVVTYTSLIQGLCQSEKLGEALSLFEQMRRKGVKPNVFTYSSLMGGLCKNGHSLHAMELLDMMVHQKLSPNMITYSTLIHGLCKDGNLRDALELFDRMKLQGLTPDAGLYEKIINGFCDMERFEKAANFLDEMTLAAIPPNRLTWCIHVRIHNNVVQGLCEANLKRAFLLYLNMRARGFSVEPAVFFSLVKGLCEKGDIDRACHVIDEMVCDGCIPDVCVWNIILDRFCDERKLWEAIDLIQLQLVDC